MSEDAKSVNEQKLYSMQELADMLHITKQTLYNNISKGKLHLTKIGKSYYITEERMKEILENGFS